jgi:hypothetical protein
MPDACMNDDVPTQSMIGAHMGSAPLTKVQVLIKALSLCPAHSLFPTRAGASWDRDCHAGQCVCAGAAWCCAPDAGDWCCKVRRVHGWLGWCGRGAFLKQKGIHSCGFLRPFGWVNGEVQGNIMG